MPGSFQSTRDKLTRIDGCYGALDNDCWQAIQACQCIDNLLQRRELSNHI